MRTFRIFSILAAVILAVSTQKALCQGFPACQGIPDPSSIVERVYIATDRTCYLAGERIWCSAFCLDFSENGGGRLSTFSSVAYLELVAYDGTVVATAKIALEGGRGAGHINIPEGAPTGNCALVAYTALNRNEKDYDFLENSRTLKIFNTFSLTRTDGAVKSVNKSMAAILGAALNSGQRLSSDTFTTLASIAIPQELASSSSFSFTLSNPSSSRLALSISAVISDSLEEDFDNGLEDFNFNSPLLAEYDWRFPVDFDGETICAKLRGKDADKVVQGTPAFISTPSLVADTYVSELGSDGMAYFRTYNIFGRKDLVMNIGDGEKDYSAHFDIISPFVKPGKPSLPELELSPDMRQALLARMETYHHERSFLSDSAVQLLPRKERSPLHEEDMRSYVLSDYTRFSSVKEILVEIIPELRTRGLGNNRRIDVFSLGEGPTNEVSWSKSLVLLNGVPIFRHGTMLDYDANFLKEVRVWQQNYIFGGRIYKGVVNFITRTGNVAYIDLGSNVHIVDFEGPAYPQEFTERIAPEGEKDLRRTAIWKPIVELASGETISIECLAPDIPGKYLVTVEGISAEGKTFRIRKHVYVN